MNLHQSDLIKSPLLPKISLQKIKPRSKILTWKYLWNIYFLSHESHKSLFFLPGIISLNSLVSEPRGNANTTLEILVHSIICYLEIAILVMIGEKPCDKMVVFNLLLQLSLYNKMLMKRNRCIWQLSNLQISDNIRFRWTGLAIVIILLSEAHQNSHTLCQFSWSELSGFITAGCCFSATEMLSCCVRWEGRMTTLYTFNSFLGLYPLDTITTFLLSLDTKLASRNFALEKGREPWFYIHEIF